MAGRLAAKQRVVNELVDAIDRHLQAHGIRDAEYEWDDIIGTRHFRLFVISRRFGLYYHSERQDMVWDAAEERLSPRDLMRVTMIVTATPQELGMA